MVSLIQTFQGKDLGGIRMCILVDLDLQVCQVQLMQADTVVN
jgi:hypothetical protein